MDVYYSLVLMFFLCFFLPSLSLALGLGHGQDLILLLTIEKRNIQGATKTVVSSRATTAASEGHTTSEVEAEAEATSNVDATSVVVGVEATTTTTTTFVLTGKIISKTLKKSNDNSSSSKTIHKKDFITSRIFQEAPLVVTLATLKDPPHHYPDNHIILPLPHTRPLPNAGKTCC